MKTLMCLKQEKKAGLHTFIKRALIFFHSLEPAYFMFVSQTDKDA